MKKLIKIVSLLVFIISAVGAQAQLPYTYGRDLIQQYGLSNITHGSRFEISEAMTANSVYFTEATGTCGEDVISKLFAVNLELEVTNSNTEVEGFLYLFTKNGDLAWVGSTRFPFLQPAYRYDILSSVSYAEVRAYRADGTIGFTYPQDIGNLGSVLLDPWVAGTVNSKLFTIGFNGQPAEYHLHDPARPVLPEITSNEAYRIGNHYVFTDLNKNVMIHGFDVPSTYHILSRPKKFPIDVIGFRYVDGSFIAERPYAIITTLNGVTKVTNLDTTKASSYNYAAGETRSTYAWLRFGQGQKLYAGEEEGTKQ